MKKLLVLGTLVLSAVAFSQSENLLNELKALDAQYKSLSAQETARFNEEKAQAEAAKAALAKNEKLYAQLTQRAQLLSTEANTKFYKDQYEALAKKYDAALKQLASEMDAQKAVISDFQKIESLQNN